MLKNSSILITGGTGSFGKTFLPLTLKKYSPKKIIIFSRDEMKQWEMKKIYKDDNRVMFFIGDIRERERIYRALNRIDYVIHAAAIKIVPTAEYNPFEVIKTNINGAMNLIDAAIDQKVKKVIALSTDKASSPINLYGATKLASDKLFVASNSSYASGHDTIFSVVRYGNVMGSRGSIIPFFIKNKKKLFLTITDKRMTRFMITLDEGVKMVWKAFEDMVGAEIYVKKIPSIKVVDIAKAINPKAKHKIIGIRPGEKLHEEMISSSDSHNTYEFKDYFKILPSINNWNKDRNRIKDGILVPDGFSYTSNNNSEWMSSNYLKNWILKNKKKIGTI
jgi:UDP-N-acetylglucosamine 4,6-dehydratase